MQTRDSADQANVDVIAREAKLVSATAVTAVGSLAIDLAHEVNNPLAVILANIEEAIRVTSELDPAANDAGAQLEELRSMLEETLVASERIQGLTRDLRVFSFAEERSVRLDVNGIVEASANLAVAEIRRRARLTKDLRARMAVIGSEVKLAHVFFNLLVNAAHAIPQGGVDDKEIRVTTADGANGVTVTVEDSGAGIPTADAERVFEPFVTTRQRRPGMGLTICRAIVSAHGGTIAIEPREGGGTVVRVVLPAAPAEPPRA